jgi:hypothetical protein
MDNREQRIGDTAPIPLPVPQNVELPLWQAELHVVQ